MTAVLFSLVGIILASGGIGITDWRLYVIFLIMAVLVTRGAR